MNRQLKQVACSSRLSRIRVRPHDFSPTRSVSGRCEIGRRGVPTMSTGKPVSDRAVALVHATALGTGPALHRCEKRDVLIGRWQELCCKGKLRATMMSNKSYPSKGAFLWCLKVTASRAPTGKAFRDV